ncbi:sensor histidine kinase [Sphingomonas sp.]|uniref:sensor histidine kinase n=1 Tax=Sphingomonas sp. TaxID=28214 RepID=UPI003D6D30FE
MKALQMPAPGNPDYFRSGEGEHVAAAREPASLATAGIVHDLGNLIQIASAAINIVERSPHMAPADSGPMLHRARVSLEHAGAIVRQNVGHLRDRAMAVLRSDVAACLADVVTLVGAMDGPGLILDLDIAPDLPAVRCDPTGLRRAVLNLVLNARDAMGGNGIVSIDARALGHGEVELRVLDDGVGMSRARLARVFDPFFTTKTDGLGGIGLPMVERFVRDADGTIAIESELGIGTTITLRLPAIAGPIAADRFAGANPLRDESGR